MTAVPAARPAYEWPEGKTSAFCFTIDVDAESPYQWSLPEGAPVALGLGRVEVAREVDHGDACGFALALQLAQLAGAGQPLGHLGGEVQP